MWQEIHFLESFMQSNMSFICVCLCDSKQLNWRAKCPSYWLYLAHWQMRKTNRNKSAKQMKTNWEASRRCGYTSLNTAVSSIPLRIYTSLLLIAIVTNCYVQYFPLRHIAVVHSEIENRALSISMCLFAFSTPIDHFPIKETFWMINISTQNIWPGALWWKKEAMKNF